VEKNPTKYTHLQSLPLPPGAIIKVGEQQIASPELVFLQLAQELGFLRTVLLGLQLCGHEVGNPGQSLSTVAFINKFVQKCGGHRGCTQALRAAKYLADGSASIMESLLYMILTLPTRDGGFGLGGAKLGKRQRIRSKSYEAAHQQLRALLPSEHLS